MVEDWLTDLLAKGPVGTAKVRQLAAPLSITNGMIEEACRKLGYLKGKIGFQGGWFWKKPEPPKPKEPEEIDPEVLKETAWLDKPVQRRSPPHKIPPGPPPWVEADRLAAAGLNGVPANGQPVAPGTEQPSADSAPDVAPTAESNGAVEEPAVPAAVDPAPANPGSADGDMCAPRDSLAPLENPQENDVARTDATDKKSEPRMTPMDADDGRTDEQKEGGEH
jgi:hypothetical protein